MFTNYRCPTPGPEWAVKVFDNLKKGPLAERAGTDELCPYTLKRVSSVSINDVLLIDLGNCSQPRCSVPSDLAIL